MHPYDLSPPEQMGTPCKILLTDTNRWAISARLASELCKLGCEIAIVCRVPGHPAETVRGIKHIFRYRGAKPLDSLQNAIETFDPEIVIPSGDRDVELLHELHAKSIQEGRTSRITKLIEESLGAPDGFHIASSRFELLALAQEEGIRVPKQIAIHCERDLELLNLEAGVPWALKADCTSEGKGVRFVENIREARKFFLEYSRFAGVATLLKKLLLNRDWDWVTFDWRHSRRPVIAQSVVQGRPANCAVSCWRGEVRAAVAVEAVMTRGASGPATIVRVVDGTKMIAAAKTIARRLESNGFFGLDFVIEKGTEIPYLIEMNPRCTPPCFLRLGEGRNLFAALWSQLTGKPFPQIMPVIDRSTIAYFPADLDGITRTGDSNSIYRDSPEGEPELIQNILHPRSVRSPLGQLLDWIRRKQIMEATFQVDFDDAAEHLTESEFSAR